MQCVLASVLIDWKVTTRLVFVWFSKTTVYLGMCGTVVGFFGFTKKETVQYQWCVEIAAQRN